ncbi:unnamed protein product [Caenorhabditis brenneri]
MGSTILIGVLLLFAVCSNASITPRRLPSFELNPPSPSNAKQFPRLDNVTDDLTVDDAERMNRDWSVNDAKYMVASTCQYEGVRIPYGWCRHQGLKASGKYKLAFIGNSYVSNHATMLYQECADKANSMLQGSAYGCEPLYPSDKDPECIANFTDFEVHIRDEKPDYAFILTRYISIGDPFPAGVTTFDEDPIYQTMKEQMLKFISNIKYKLYIMDAFPRVNQPMVHQIGRLMKEKEDPVKIDEMLVKPHNFEMARKRHAQLMKDCGGKCEMIDYVPDLFNKTTKTFRFFDERGFSYITSALHMSMHGIEHVRHLWRDVCANL